MADANNQIGTIYCSSGSQTSGIGQWFAPNGAEITQNSASSFTSVRGGGNFPSYAGLQLKTGLSFSTSDEGVYTCVIPDESGIQQTLHAGLYRRGYFGKCQRYIYSIYNIIIIVTFFISSSYSNWQSLKHN